MLNDVDCVGKLRDTEGFVPFKARFTEFGVRFSLRILQFCTLEQYL